MRAEETFVVLVVAVAVAAVVFTVLYHVIRAAVTEGMKRHTVWARETPPGHGPLDVP